MLTRALIISSPEAAPSSAALPASSNLITPPSVTPRSLAILLALLRELLIAKALASDFNFSLSSTEKLGPTISPIPTLPNSLTISPAEPTL